MLGAFLLAGPLLFAPASPATVPRESRDQAAVEAYRRGDFETARSLWIASLEAPFEGGGPDGNGNGAAPRLSSAERGRILYDLGNAAYRQGNVPEAVGWYTASLRARPRDADAWRNLEHARATAKLEPADRGDLAATGWRLVNSLTAVESEWLALGGALLWCAALTAEALRGGRLFRRLALLGFFLALATLSPWIYHRAHDGRDTVLVIEASERGVEVKSEPRADATVIGNVAAGEEIEREDELPGWIKAEVPGGISGWIESRATFSLQR